MRKIILVSNTSWYLFNFRLSIIKLLQNKGFQVICIANHDDYSKRLEAEGVEFIQSDLANKGTNPLKDYGYYSFLKKQYQAIKPTFIFHYTVKPNIYGSMAAHNQNIRSIGIVSGAGHAFLRKGLLNTLVKSLYRYAAKCANQLWFVNEDDRQLFLNAGIISKERTTVLPGEGINTENFKRDTPYSVNKDYFVFLLSARMLWDKGVGVFVDAAREVKKKYPGAKFKLLGFIDAVSPSAISKEQMDQWVADGVIEYLGVTDNVKKYLNQATCFVLPSYYREGVPRALLEAASMGIPIITTDNVGCREVVENGYNGFICTSKSIDELAQRMEQMLEMDEAALQKMGINGREKVNMEFHERLVLKYYEDIVNEHLTP
jgi:glycosyltransferase involved in cell wall biosynthesis